MRPYVGFGVVCEFDPSTGALRATGAATEPARGVYGDVGDVPAVFYRSGSELAVRVGQWSVDPASPGVVVRWDRQDQHTHFAVLADGVPLCQVDYRSLPPELDLGLMIRDVCADPDRRAEIFQQ